MQSSFRSVGGEGPARFRRTALLSWCSSPTLVPYASRYLSCPVSMKPRWLVSARVMLIRLACSLSMTRCVCPIHSRSFSLLTSLQKESVARQTRTSITNATIALVDEVILGPRERVPQDFYRPAAGNTLTGTGSSKFTLLPDDTALVADGVDATRVVPRVTGEFDNIRRPTPPIRLSSRWKDLANSWETIPSAWSEERARYGSGPSRNLGPSSGPPGIRGWSEASDHGTIPRGTGTSVANSGLVHTNSSGSPPKHHLGSCLGRC
jgi:hypothetical protein